MKKKRKKVMILGTGGHARSCLDIVEQNNNLELIGFIEQKKSKKKFFFKNYKIVGSEVDLENLKKKTSYIILGISFYKNLQKRKLLIEKLKKNKFKLLTIKAKNSHIAKDVKIGSGCQIFNNVIINKNSKIGDNVVINNGTVIEHDNEIKNNAHISTRVVINGNCSIGENVFIGSGSILKENIKIKKNKFIKMASVIIK